MGLSRYSRMVRDPEKLKAWVTAVGKSEGFKVWGIFVVIAVALFWVCSSGEFSFMLTMSSMVSMFSFLMVAMTIERTQSVQGISMKMMECYMAVFLCRLFAIIPFEGYLPYDKSGDWLYQVSEAVGLCLSGSIVYCCRSQFASTYDPDMDTFQQIWIVGPAAGIALVLHPHLNNFMLSDIAWAFALYLESVTVLPQFFMFMKEKKAQPHTSHFLAAQALSRLVSTIFWGSSFTELGNPEHQIKRWVGHWVVVVQLAQLVIMGDFIWHYIRALQKGIPISDVLSSTLV